MLKIKGFEWDENNTVHLELKHGVTPEEAEEVFAVKPLFRKTKHKGRYSALGRTSDGRFLHVIFLIEKGGTARIITGWDMKSSDIKYYKKNIK